MSNNETLAQRAEELSKKCIPETMFFAKGEEDKMYEYMSGKYAMMKQLQDGSWMVYPPWWYRKESSEQ